MERAEAALEGVSEGPWASYGHGVATVVNHCTCGAGGPLGHESGCGLEHPVATETIPADAHFIAAARDLVPELATTLKRVVALADHYDALATELPEPHGPVTEAFSTAARDIRRVLAAASTAEQAVS